TRERVHRVCAGGRPSGDEVQVGRQAPGQDRLEHVVLEDEVLGVGPVGGDVTVVVVAHDVHGVASVGRVVAHRGDEPVHHSVVDVGQGVGVAVRPADVGVGGVVVGHLALAGNGVGDAHGEVPLGVAR